MHLCPLKDNEPATHSSIAKSKLASGKIIAGFFASNPNTKRNLFLLGCKSCKAIADLLLPIKAKIATRPDFIIGEATSRPRPYNMLIAPFGKLLLKASNKGDINKTPSLAGLKITGFPIINAGISKEKVSFKG